MDDAGPGRPICRGSGHSNRSGNDEQLLNNEITQRHYMLAGRARVVGLILFYAVCSVGVIGNVGVATLLLSAAEAHLVTRRVRCALIGTVWNYAVSATLIWQQR
jgi:dolichol-phosphate mannosyltransferase